MTQQLTSDGWIDRPDIDQQVEEETAIQPCPVRLIDVCKRDRYHYHSDGEECVTKTWYECDHVETRQLADGPAYQRTTGIPHCRDCQRPMSPGTIHWQGDRYWICSACERNNRQSASFPDRWHVEL